MHLKESYQRTILYVTEFDEDDVIATSGEPNTPINDTGNGLPIGVGIPGENPTITPPGAGFI